jgi:CRISPR-associated protein Cas2
MTREYKLIAVAYDVEDDRQRDRLHKALKDFGTPVQKSVFECELTQAQIDAMETEIRRLVDERADKVRIYLLCERCARRTVSIPSRRNPPVETLVI